MENPGIATDLMFDRVRGTVTREAAYRVLRTPTVPDYYFGNALILDDAPTDRERERLERDFDRLVKTSPAIRHRTFVWPVGEEGVPSLPGFVAAGYELHENRVLMARADDLIPPARPNPDIVVRPYDGEADWAAWHAMSMADNAGYFPEPAHSAFLAGKRDIYERLIAAGRGQWWGAYLYGRQVGHLGLFFDGDGEAAVGRFQSVMTHPDHRGRGICRTLVHEIALRGFARAPRLVMVADEHYHAARIYESLGFAPCARTASLCWWPKE